LSRVGVVSSLFLVRAWAFCLTTDVIPKADLDKRVPMTAIATRWNPEAPLNTPDFRATFEGGHIVLQGRNRGWRASLPPAGRAAWRTGAGQDRTYYFSGYTGASGIGAPAWIFILSFDTEGRPIPFYLVGYSVYDDQGITDLLNLDGTGPQLLHQNWCETGWDRNSMQSGFWITTLYQRSGGYWRRIDGRHGTMTYPLFEKWSSSVGYLPQLVRSPPIPEECVQTYGNDRASGVTARVLSLTEEGLHVEPVGDCDVVFPFVIVVDTQKGRQIEVEQVWFERGPLAELLARTRASVMLSGVNRLPRSRSCVAAVMWREGGR
jgi:hypothetical protein